MGNTERGEENSGKIYSFPKLAFSTHLLGQSFLSRHWVLEFQRPGWCAGLTSALVTGQERDRNQGPNWASGEHVDTAHLTCASKQRVALDWSSQDVHRMPAWEGSPLCLQAFSTIQIGTQCLPGRPTDSIAPPAHRMSCDDHPKMHQEAEVT